MNAEDVAELHAAMRAYGIPGTLAPVDAGDPAGEWRVLDSAGRDVTAGTLAAAATARARRPARGFVVG
ncbi:hypothetical protein C0216_09000 [Streptomyces globosus]|uniref:Uncharacterized protein n=1 Tax=Streptomyces globosus TaxID=68209 RepID=A0A344TY63_9ACTN|nr:hypothetical protein [Streptomyces globosus]AXE23584.1 hypothetical protein C0216_09000 [Streptomyces globosus]